ncbi:MAG: division plane positioning ATPase MipZ [Alphaproteobacteria bacterium]
MHAHVLLIEDDPSVAKSIELILDAQGYGCVRADTGEGGLEIARQDRFDIILLDLSLPDMNGHEVLRDLRAGKVLTPVLILSGSDSKEDKIKGLGIGADDYVTKPFDKDELVARIQAILRRAHGPSPSLKASALQGSLLARNGHAAPWEFAVAYAPPGSTPPAAPAIDPNALPHRAQANPSGPRLEVPRAPVRSAGGARVIVLGNAKGGTGKSTTAMHLIVGLMNEGRKVGSLDLDIPQGTLSRYIENRCATAASKSLDLPIPDHHSVTPGDGAMADFKAALARLADSCDDVVIDTPGHDNELSRLAHAAADLLITPINDSFLDLDVLAQIEADSLRILRLSHYSEMVIEARRQRRENDGGSIEWFVLRNRLSHLNARNKRDMSTILHKLAKKIGFRDGLGLSERVIYRELFLSGLTLLDMRDKRTGQQLTLSHVAARQELLKLLAVVQPPARKKNAKSKPATRKGSRVALSA